MTVKDKKRGRPKATKPSLSQQIIIEHAKSLLKKNKKQPSIRQLAVSLEVDAMAIYHYFKNKNALLEAICVSLISDLDYPQSGDWQLELQALCHSYLNLLQAYSGLLETMLTLKVEGPAQVFHNKFSQITAPLALNKQDENAALCLLVDYLHGFALAMQCNPNSSELNVEMIEQPVKLMIRGLKSAAISDSKSSI